MAKRQNNTLIRRIDSTSQKNHELSHNFAEQLLNHDKFLSAISVQNICSCVESGIVLGTEKFMAKSHKFRMEYNFLLFVQFSSDKNVVLH